jgi:hypothetical protein
MQQLNSVSITSTYFIDKIEDLIVKLAKALSLEHSIPIDSAKVMARQIIQRRLNSLLTEEEKKGIENITNTIKEDLKRFNGTAGQLLNCEKVYELLKTMELL